MLQYSAESGQCSEQQEHPDASSGRLLPLPFSVTMDTTSMYIRNSACLSLIF
jgi:hypothetical protein